MTTTPWTGDVEAKPAPEPLRRVQALINTLDKEDGQDRLAATDDARAWLTDNALLEPGATLDAQELRLVVGVREGLRGLVIHNTGGPAPDSEAMVSLHDIASGPVRAVVGADGRVSLGCDGDTLRARLTSLLLVVKDAQLDGTWAHLKACANDGCQWAFYDRSRNHGGTWCDMASCGNKLKNRDFRERQRQTR